MGLTIGIDLGGTKIAGGVVDEGGSITLRARRDTPARDVEAVEGVIVELVRELAKGREIEAVGIGAAGLIDEKRSRVLMAPNLGWTDEPLRSAVEREIGLPVVVENDANAAAWGEYRFGAGQGCDNLVCVTVGTGIGGGLVFHGQMYRGAHGVAAEFGHLCVEPGGRLCGCGNRGCWEQYASGHALVRAARTLAAENRDQAEQLLALGDGTPEGVDGTDVTTAAAEGDQVALEAFAEIGKWLGSGLASVVEILDPGRILLGGGVSSAGRLLLDPTKRAFQESVVGRKFRPTTPVELASLGNDAGIVGAADLARQS